MDTIQVLGLTIAFVVSALAGAAIAHLRGGSLPIGALLGVLTLGAVASFIATFDDFESGPGLWRTLGLIVLTFTTWCSEGLARNKGRSPIVGGLLGFLLGPIGLLVVAVMPTNQRVVFERREEWRRR